MNKNYIDKIKKIKKSIKEIEEKLYDEEDVVETIYLKKQLKMYNIMLANSI